MADALATIESEREQVLQLLESLFLNESEDATTVCKSGASASSWKSARSILNDLVKILAPQGIPSSELLDMVSFDLIGPIVSHIEANPDVCRSILEALSKGANPRELVVLLLDALGAHTSPLQQLALLQMLPNILMRLSRGRQKLVVSCFEVLQKRYVQGWPLAAARWESVDKEEALSTGLHDVLLQSAALLLKPTADLQSADITHDRRVAVAFLLCLLEQAALGLSPVSESAVLDLLAEASLSLAELCQELQLTTPESTSDTATPDTDKAEASVDEARQWPRTALALYVHAVVCSRASCAPALLRRRDELEAALSTLPCTDAIDVALAAASLLLSCASQRWSMCQRGRELLTATLRHTSPHCFAESCLAPKEQCANALIKHMACHPEQTERSTAYRTLQRLLDCWPFSKRLGLLQRLLQECDYSPAASALLVHRLKEEYLRERNADASGDTGSAPEQFCTPQTLLPILKKILSPEYLAIDTLDAVMSALNLLRFLLLEGASRSTTPHASAEALSTSTASQPPQEHTAQVQSESVLADSSKSELAGTERLLSAADVAFCQKKLLLPVDRKLRLLMDTEWAKAGMLEREGPAESDESTECRARFTRLQLTLDVLERVAGLCSECRAKRR